MAGLVYFLVHLHHDILLFTELKSIIFEPTGANHFLSVCLGLLRLHYTPLQRYNTTDRPNIKQNRGKIYSLKNVVFYRKDKAAGTQFLPSPCDMCRIDFSGIITCGTVDYAYHRHVECFHFYLSFTWCYGVPEPSTTWLDRIFALKIRYCQKVSKCPLYRSLNINLEEYLQLCWNNKRKTYLVL